MLTVIGIPPGILLFAAGLGVMLEPSRPARDERWVTRVRAAVQLRHAEMPRAEIRAILAADDPGVVRRYLELRERLEEEAADRRRILVSGRSQMPCGNRYGVLPDPDLSGAKVG